MAFKVKSDDKAALRLVTFRFPVNVIAELQKVAKREGVSVTQLVLQMIRHCLDEYKRASKSEW